MLCLDQTLLCNPKREDHLVPQRPPIIGLLVAGCAGARRPLLSSPATARIVNCVSVLLQVLSRRTTNMFSAATAILTNGVQCCAAMLNSNPK
jgi:hypothetical protein